MLTEIIIPSLKETTGLNTIEEKEIVLLFILKWKTEQSISCESKCVLFWLWQTECSCFSKECTNCTAKGNSIVVTSRIEIICLKNVFIIL